MALTVRPLTRDAAFAFVRAHHSHLPVPPASWLFGAGVFDGDRLCCVAIVGRPPRLLQDGRTAEVTRVASDGTEHAASKAVAAVARAAIALGYTRLVSYTRLGEAGTSYRAAGWRVTATTRGGEWSRPSRARKPAAEPGVKVRWETGPNAAPASPEAEAMAREAATKREAA
jgi:hypothetical protein